MPVVILEAMAAGCAVITTDVGAIPEVIEDGKQGILCRPGDVTGLRRAILELNDGRSGLERMQQNAYERADDFSPARFRQRLVAIYDDILDVKRA